VSQENVFVHPLQSKTGGSARLFLVIEGAMAAHDVFGAGGTYPVQSIVILDTGYATTRHRQQCVGSVWICSRLRH